MNLQEESVNKCLFYKNFEYSNNCSFKNTESREREREKGDRKRELNLKRAIFWVTNVIYYPMAHCYTNFSLGYDCYPRKLYLKWR